jgi:hypothetical protein
MYMMNLKAYFFFFIIPLTITIEKLEEGRMCILVQSVDGLHLGGQEEHRQGNIR